MIAAFRKLWEDERHTNNLRECRILHLGAGDITGLPIVYNNVMQAKHVVYVEARLSVVLEMQQKYPTARIHHACISNKSQIMKFTETRDGSLSSLEKIVHPRVAPRGHRFLKTQTMTEVMSMFKLSPKQFSVLVIETCGSELNIIQTMPETLWSHVNYVLVASSAGVYTSMETGTKMQKDLIMILEMLGFTHLFSVDDVPYVSNAAFFVHVFQR